MARWPASPGRGGRIGHGWLNDYTIADYPGFYSDGIGTGVAVDPDGGAVYVSDLENYVDYLQPDLTNPDNGTLDFGGPDYALSFVCWVCLGKGSNSTSPAGVAFDCRSNLYVLDPGIDGVDVYVNQSPPSDPPCVPANVSRPAILGHGAAGRQAEGTPRQVLEREQLPVRMGTMRRAR